MSAECCAHAGPPRTARALGPWLGLASGLLALAVPKCPLCVAAWLSLLGLGLGAGRALALLLPALGMALCALALGGLWLRRRPPIFNDSASEQASPRKVG